MGILDIFRGKGLHCPRDKTRLTQHNHNGNAIDRCPSCNGIWIEGNQLRRIANHTELDKADAWAGNYPQKSGFQCPACNGDCCGTFLEEFNVHTCIQCHGIWMDNTEINTARRRITIDSSTRSGPELRAFLAKL